MYTDKENEWLDELVVELSELIAVWHEVTKNDLKDFQSIKYKSPMVKLYLSAIMDYFDEFIFLLSVDRHTLLVQTIRSIIECYVLLIILVCDQNGVDILSNIADRHTIRTKSIAIKTKSDSKNTSDKNLIKLMKKQIDELESEICKRENKKEYSMRNLINKLPIGRVGINSSLFYQWSYYSEYSHVGWKSEIQKREYDLKSSHSIDFIKRSSNLLVIMLFELNFIVVNKESHKKFADSVEKCFRGINKY